MVIKRYNNNKNDQVEHNNGLPINDLLPEHHDDLLPNDPELRRLTRIRRPNISDDYIVYLDEVDIEIKDNPRTFKEAIESVNSDKWLDATKKRIGINGHP